MSAGATQSVRGWRTSTDADELLLSRDLAPTLTEPLSSEYKTTSSKDSARGGGSGDGSLTAPREEVVLTDKDGRPGSAMGRPENNLGWPRVVDAAFPVWHTAICKLFGETVHCRGHFTSWLGPRGGYGA